MKKHKTMMTDEGWDGGGVVLYRKDKSSPTLISLSAESDRGTLRGYGICNLDGIQRIHKLLLLLLYTMDILAHLGDGLEW